VLRSEPRNVDANHLLGVIKAQQGESSKALQLIEIAAKQAPGSPVILMNHGNALKAVGRAREALVSYDRAIALQPNYADVWANRGIVLRELGRHLEALASYDKAVALNPQLFAGWYNRGNALKDLARYEEAITSYRRALALQPEHAEANFNLGLGLLMRGSTDEAIASFERVLSVEPDLPDARFARAIAELPVLYEDEAEVGRRRALYSEQLDRLVADAAKLRRPHTGLEACLPFFLAYQGLNDCELQRRFGKLVCRLTEPTNPPADRLAPPPGPGEPVRVGIVSGHFFFHSVWKIPIKGWLSQLDRRRFRLFCYHTTGIEDAETGVARSLSERFVMGPLGLDAWRKEVLADRPHVIIYPEIGMDPRTAQLAALRLAPVQCVSLGHPNTTGFPTIDYFLSSAPMEPEDGADHYTERLVRLPGLSIYYEPVVAAPAAVSRQELGLRAAATAFWCGQSLFKYLPQHDDVFPRIARQVADCQFVFIDYAGGSPVNDLFRRRLRRAFASHGLDSNDHCVHLGRMGFSRFSAAMGQCDIFLNSISWSGFNTTMESLEHDLPIVTMTTPLMRGRHTLAILELMGCNETIASTLDDYVAIAVRLANDCAWRAAIKAKIARCKHVLYRDRATIAALENFLENAARSPTA
jgi:predicted O-linked N-acetylglucosamine transferase (SPINDLY family)